MTRKGDWNSICDFPLEARSIFCLCVELLVMETSKGRLCCRRTMVGATRPLLWVIMWCFGYVDVGLVGVVVWQQRIVKAGALDLGGGPMALLSYVTR